MSKSVRIASELIEKIKRELAANRPVRERLPGGGLIHIDRQLPFVCIYREPGGRDDAGTRKLVQSEASYIIGGAQDDIS